MIARFSGRSAHTVRIKNKPTPEGYKILSLCDAGYTYTFIFTSRIQNQIERIRHRPRETSTNAAKVRAIFGHASKKSLPIPVVIDDYNHFMGGVDIADQLRGYYGTQLTVRRTWMPLFFWLLDTAIINSYLILKKINTNISQKDFRLQIVWDLIEESLKESEKKPHTRNQV